eukprot:COSAG06_NODE_4444_length_4257_cov_2.427609_8_plen_143_part_01
MKLPRDLNLRGDLQSQGSQVEVAAKSSSNAPRKRTPLSPEPRDYHALASMLPVPAAYQYTDDELPPTDPSQQRRAASVLPVQRHNLTVPYISGNVTVSGFQRRIARLQQTSSCLHFVRLLFCKRSTKSGNTRDIYLNTAGVSY